MTRQTEEEETSKSGRRWEQELGRTETGGWEMRRKPRRMSPDERSGRNKGG